MQQQALPTIVVAENDVLERALKSILADPRELSWDDDYTRLDNYDALLAGEEVLP